MDMDSNQVEKEVVDDIQVKKYQTENMAMVRVQSDNFGVFSGDSLPKALRNMAESLELSNKASKVSNLSVDNIEEGSNVVSLSQSEDDEEEPVDKETLSKS